MEELFSSHFEGYREEPSPGMWGRIRTQLFWKEFFHFSLNSLNIYYTAVVAAALVGGIVLITNMDTKRESSRTDRGDEMIDRELIPEALEPTEVDPSTPDNRTGVEETEKGTGITEGEPGKTRPRETTAKADAGTEKEQAGRLLKEGSEPGARESDTDQQALTIPEEILVIAGFEATKYQGCAPLAVEFTNLSENATGYSWSFGDGGKSSEKNPSYVFDEPGEHTVQLKVTGLDGYSYTASRSVSVFITPRAQFEYDEDVSITGGQPVNFYNFSRDAEYFAWDFGDGEQSGLSDPVHYYSAPGEYDVTLVAWTANRCFDSLKVSNAFALTENTIIFPNAFTPNTSGPVGGYYTPGDPANEVFYPVVQGELLEYELKIYNRLGQVIFESKDINYGWDGYYQDQLSAQGVYIWKARGRYANGKTFVRSGDITLIWK